MKTKKSQWVKMTEELKDLALTGVHHIGETIKAVAPVVWKTMLMKVIADSVGIILVVIAILVSTFIIFDNIYVRGVSFPICAIILGSAIRRIIAANYFVLMEILKIVREKGE